MSCAHVWINLWYTKSWLIGKDSDAGRDWGQEEKGTTEDEMAGWHHWLYGCESEWTPGDGDGQGGLVCCNSWGRKESDTTQRLNWTELNWSDFHLFTHTLQHCQKHSNLTSGKLWVSSCWESTIPVQPTHYLHMQNQGPHQLTQGQS